MSTPLRRSAYGAAILLLTGALVAPMPASASFSGTPGVLTASFEDGISFENQPGKLLPTVNGVPVWSFDFSSAKWSPDGSRAVFIGNGFRPATVRFDNGTAVTRPLGPGPYDGFERRDATYRSDGRTIVWAQRDETDPDARFQLAMTSSTPESGTVIISPDDGAQYLQPDGGGPDGRLVFVRYTGTGSPEIWIWDGLGTEPANYKKITDGVSPALSPDGTQIAYVSLGARLWRADVTGANAAQVTTDDVSAFGPTWSPDGSTIAFASDGVVRKVAATGGASVPTTLTGRPAYRSAQKNTMTRLSGPSRQDTAAAVSQYHWKTAGTAADPRQQAESVVLSRSDTFADALSGSALAAAKRGPLLLTTTESLYLPTYTEIQRVLGDNSSAIVYLLGGTGAISTDVEMQVRDLGYTVVRLAGADRYATSLEIADAIDPSPAVILAATGADFPDALAAGAAAGSFNGPGSEQPAVVVLTADRALPNLVKSYLDNRAPEADLYAIGGQAAAATQAYDPVDLVGTTRYQTATLVGQEFFPGPAYAGVATGENWPDALAGGALMARLNGPLLLTGSGTTLTGDTAAYLSANCTSLHTGLVFGGSAVVSTSQLNQAGTWLSGPAGYITTGA